MKGYAKKRGNYCINGEMMGSISVKKGDMDL